MTDESSPLIAILLGGGMGSRFGSSTPKQLAPLAGGTVISHTAKAFEHCLEVERLIVVTNEKWSSEIESEVRRVTQRLEVEFVHGGTSRNESLRNALTHVVELEARLLIHDAVRPLVTVELIRTVAEALRQSRCALPVIRSSDLLVAASGNTSEPLRFLSRDEVFRGQSPQGFMASDLRETFRESNDTYTTMLPTIYEAVQHVLPDREIELVHGIEENIKITLPVDHMIAQRLIEERDAMANTRQT